MTVSLPLVFTNTYKVKLPLCIPWRQAPEASLILNFNARWRWVFSFTPQPFFPMKKTLGIHWIEGLVSTRAALDILNKRNSLAVARNRTPGHPACSLHDVTILTELLKPPDCLHKAVWLWNYGCFVQCPMTVQDKAKDVMSTHTLTQ